VEAASAIEVHIFATSTAELNPRAFRLVPPEDVSSIFYIKNPFTFDGKDWARISGRGKGWSVYKNDIGMIASNGGSPILVVIPRIRTSHSKTRHRPEQKLFPLTVAKAFFSENSIEEDYPRGSFRFNDQRFLTEGFLYCDIDKVDLCRPADDMPTQIDLQTFKACSIMNRDSLARTTLRLEQSKVVSGSRITIIHGEFRGLLGRVIDTAENEVTILIDSLNHTQSMLKSTVRSAYRVGDEIQIYNGKYSGNIGWIVDVDDQMVTVVNVEKDMEAIIPVIFFS